MGFNQLFKKPIVDKNGKRNTVHVRADKKDNKNKLGVTNPAVCTNGKDGSITGIDCYPTEIRKYASNRGSMFTGRHGEGENVNLDEVVTDMGRNLTARVDSKVTKMLVDAELSEGIQEIVLQNDDALFLKANEDYENWGFTHYEFDVDDKGVVYATGHIADDFIPKFKAYPTWNGLHEFGGEHDPEVHDSELVIDGKKEPRISMSVVIPVDDKTGPITIQQAAAVLVEEAYKRMPAIVQPPVLETAE